MIIQDKEGTGFEAFAEAHLTGNFEVIDGMFSGPSPEILEQVALASNLVVQDEERGAGRALLSGIPRAYQL
ncbi:hypothetical protein [Pseudophaeobacter sp.]|uniref:hypothetical protein n=1 Tax=Pseudophaeobacter sp. TaxID=1971739 RepID=UPI0032970EB8